MSQNTNILKSRDDDVERAVVCQSFDTATRFYGAMAGSLIYKR